MEQLSIVTEHEPMLIEDKLLHMLPQNVKKNISIKLHITPQKKVNCIELTINQPTPNINKHLANVMTECIIENYEFKILYKIINVNYGYFTVNERKEILKKSIDRINLDKTLINNMFTTKRRNIINNRLREYLGTSDKIVLDGFVRFRLKDYWDELEEIVEKSVDDFLVEREYNEFIELLKYFVDIQEPKFDLIHVKTGRDGKYLFFDELEKDITKICIANFVNEVRQKNINYDDLLISSLIYISPKKIILHKMNNMKNKQLFETLSKVFEGRISFCNHCSFCK